MLSGRGHELDRLAGILDAAAAGRGQALVISGEAGIGKTALLEHAARLHAPRPMLRAAGTEAETDLPFAALHALLHPIRKRIDALPAPQADALRTALGHGPAEGGHDRFLVGLAVLTLLSDLSEEQPLLCLVDDAQWLDQASASALLFALRRLEAERIAVILGVRTGDRPRRFEQGPVTGLPELILTGLDPTQSAAVLADHRGDIAPAVRDRIITEAEGNPLALIELSAMLGPEHLAGKLPPLTLYTEATSAVGRVESAYRDRIEVLPQPTRLLLTLAAAEGTGDVDLIARAAAFLSTATNPTASSPALGIPDLAPAEAAGLIRVTSGTVHFRHPLVKAAAYRGAPLSTRQSAHRALAAALHHSPLEERDTADRRAHQLAAATTGIDEDLADLVEQAATRALHRGAPEVATPVYERAAQLTQDRTTRAKLLSLAAEAACSAGQLTRAAELAERCRRLLGGSAAGGAGVMDAVAGRSAEVGIATAADAGAGPAAAVARQGAADLAIGPDAVAVGAADGAAGVNAVAGRGVEAGTLAAVARHGAADLAIGPDAVAVGAADGAAGVNAVASRSAEAGTVAAVARHVAADSATRADAVAVGAALAGAGVDVVADRSAEAGTAAAAAPYVAADPAVSPDARPVGAAVAVAGTAAASHTDASPAAPTPAAPDPAADTQARLAAVRAALEFEHGDPALAGRLLADAVPPIVPTAPAQALALLGAAAGYAWFAGDGDVLRRCRRLAEEAERHTAAPDRISSVIRATEQLLLDGRTADPGLLRAVMADLGSATSADTTAATYAVFAALRTGSDPEALAAADDFVDICRRQGHISELTHALQLKAQAHFFLGQFAEVEAAAAEALHVAEAIGHTRRACHVQGVLSLTASVQGDSERCERLARSGIDGGLAPGASWGGYALGLLALGHGDHRTAADRLTALLAGPAGHTVIARFAVPSLVEARVRLGEPDRAAAALPRFQEWARGTGRPWALGVLERCHAVIAASQDPDQDVEPRFRTALDHHGSATRPFERARTLLLYGEWLRRARRRGEAADRLRTAAELFHHLGAVPWLERTTAELTAIGAGRRAVAPDRPIDDLAKLTAQEAHVVRLAAAGASNAEIAAQLFLSPRTVGYHLYNAFPKLGVTSRGELAQFVA